jgi:Predicted pPIWI-associating nuclease
MVRRVSPSQFRSMVRQAERKHRQSVEAFNRQVRSHNQKLKQAINRYNQEVRTHNSRVRANSQRLKSEIARLERSASSPRYVTFQASARVLHRSYLQLERHSETHDFDARYNDILDLSEREAANSIAVMNALLSDGTDDQRGEVEDDYTSEITDELSRIAPDLDARWRGALFALSPRNPDAARHFCTSAREVITLILDYRAPDHVVISALADCEVTRDGRPTRRSKIRFFLSQKGLLDDSLEEFVEQDVDNLLALFKELNSGTHGDAGKFNYAQLAAIRRRVENGIMFLNRLIH